MKPVEDAVEDLRQRYAAAVRARDAQALAQLYDPKVRIFDAWGVWQYQGIATWQVAIEGWLSSNPAEQLQVRFSDCSVVGGPDLATMTALVTYAGVSSDGSTSHALQNRMTWILRTSGHRLRIVHEHTSAPIGFEDMKAILHQAG